MVLILLIAMIGVPILEIVVFIEAGGYIGLWPTVGAVILTAIIGSALLRHQGLSTRARPQETGAAGRLPMTEVFDGLCILVGGALLLTPGFITDTAGFLLLVPPVRDILRRLAGRHFGNKAEMHVWTDAPSSDEGPGPAGDGPVIDGQFEEIHPEDAEARPREAEPRDAQGSAGGSSDGGSSNRPRRQTPPRVVRPSDP
jgi:UPF0716 protein FxsA